jgi:hypothetical protein
MKRREINKEKSKNEISLQKLNNTCPEFIITYEIGKLFLKRFDFENKPNEGQEFLCWIPLSYRESNIRLPNINERVFLQGSLEGSNIHEFIVKSIIQTHKLGCACKLILGK